MVWENLGGLAHMMFVTKEGKQEACLALDVALASGGCEAIVEGFYSVVKAHTMSGGQSNKVLMERSVVDWSLPHPISCPKTIAKIGQLYTNGSKSLGISKHRVPVFFDERERAARKYKVSKVVDRITSNIPRCPFLVVDDIGHN
eukprot:gene18565-20427_t